MPTVGSKGGDALLVHYTPRSRPQRDRKRKELAINHEIMTVHLYAAVLGRVSCGMVFVMGRRTFLSVYVKRGREHMAEHVNHFFDQPT